jgi:hypothetical protein
MGDIMCTRVPKISISPERVFFILQKAREFDAKVEQTDPDSGSNPSDDKNVDVLEDTANDPTFEEYLGALQLLDADEQLDLLALSWIGRGDFTAGEWSETRAEAASMRTMRTKRIPEYVTQTSQAGDYLEEDIASLGYSLEEYEKGRL